MIKKYWKHAVAAAAATISLPLAHLCKNQVHQVRQRRVESKLIQWSADGAHFLGPVNATEESEIIAWKFYTSPNGKLQVHFTNCGLVLEEKEANAASFKKLHGDGNTCYYEEKIDDNVVYRKAWDEHGNEIVLGREHKPSGWMYWN